MTLDRELAFLGDRLEHDVPLGPMTTYRVGGPARWFVEIADVDELRRIARALARMGAVSGPVLVLGRGSNLLVGDRGFDGLAVRLGERFAQVGIDGVSVSAGGAASLPVVARRTVAGGLTGFEWAVGVPGSIGGAVRMNAGGHGADMAASLVRVHLMDLVSGEDEEVPAAALDLSYRHSSVRPEQVVVGAELELERGDAAEGEKQLAEVVRWRREHQPGGQNAGSVFTNPPGDSAGRVIDASGCRGLRVRSAQVSPRHANFFQADSGGSADDIFALMVEVARQVRSRTGVELRPETKLVGFAPFDEAVGP